MLVRVRVSTLCARQGGRTQRPESFTGNSIGVRTARARDEPSYHLGYQSLLLFAVGCITGSRRDRAKEPASTRGLEVYVAYGIAARVCYIVASRRESQRGYKTHTSSSARITHTRRAKKSREISLCAFHSFVLSPIFAAHSPYFPRVAAVYQVQKEAVRVPAHIVRNTHHAAIARNTHQTYIPESLRKYTYVLTMLAAAVPRNSSDGCAAYS